MLYTYEIKKLPRVNPHAHYTPTHPPTNPRTHTHARTHVRTHARTHESLIRHSSTWTRDNNVTTCLLYGCNDNRTHNHQPSRSVGSSTSATEQWIMIAFSRYKITTSVSEYVFYCNHHHRRYKGILSEELKEASI